MFYLHRLFYQSADLMIVEDSLSFDSVRVSIHLELINMSRVDAFSGNYIYETWINGDRECRDKNCTERY